MYGVITISFPDLYNGNIRLCNRDRWEDNIRMHRTDIGCKYVD